MTFQLPPVTLVATVTRVPVLIATLSLALVDALVRRLAPQAATFWTLAPERGRRRRDRADAEHEDGREERGDEEDGQRGRAVGRVRGWREAIGVPR